MRGQTTHKHKNLSHKSFILAAILTAWQLCREAIRIDLKSVNDVYTIYIHSLTLNNKINVTQLNYIIKKFHRRNYYDFVKMNKID